MKKSLLLKSLLLLCVLMAGVNGVKAEDTVNTKWKKTAVADLTSGDVVAIVDLTNAVAMSNDKGTSKAPGAVSVTLNDSKSRITDEEVGDNVQWTVTVTGTGFKFAKSGSESEYLYGDATNGLRVGAEAANEFDMLNNFLHITLDGTNYYAGVKSSFMSSSWELLAEVEGEIDKSIKKTEIAFFKKVETTAQDIEFAFPFKNYQVDVNGNDTSTDYKYWFDLDINHNCPENISDKIEFTSSDPDVAEVVSYYGAMRVTAKNKKVGTATITAYFPGTDDGTYDDATATCTVRVEDSKKNGLNAAHPITVAEAIALASGENPPAEGVCYYIKGKVSKVNSGLMALFGEFGLDELLGDMDFDMDFDLGDLGMEGSGVSSSIPGFGNSDKTTYFISDNATKENQIKVVNGCGSAIRGGSNNCGMDLGELKGDDITVGDDIVVYGPLIYTEDSSLFGGNSGDEPKMSAKVDEVNYKSSQNRILLTEDMNMFLNSSKTPRELYTLTSIPQGVVAPEITITSSDEEIAKWVVNQESTDSVLTALKEGTAKITVKVKVILAKDDPNTEDNEEKSYVMKRKFKLNVISRDVDPLGKNNGTYVLVTDANNLHDGDRLLIVGATTKDDEVKYQALGSDDSMLGGGKGVKEVTVDNDVVSDVPDGVQEIILERDTENPDVWYLNVGENENGEKLYLYASNKPEKEEEPGEEPGGEGEGGEEESEFDISELLNMIGNFGSGASLKVGTKAEVGDSCQVAINIGADGTTLTFNVPEGKNIIKLGNAMDGFMEMFGSFMNKEDEEGAGGEEGGEAEESPMSSMDISMPSFNVFDDEDTKAVLPKLYQYVPGDEYDIYIDRTHWTTVVSDYDVTLPEEEENKLAAYIVTGVSLVDNVYESCLVLEEVESIKAGVAYLVTGVNRDGTFTLKRAVEQSSPAPKKSSVKDADLESNLLKVSDHDTADGAYLLGTDDETVGMVRWNQGVTGSGHAYLPADEVADGRPFIPIKKTSSIEGVTVDETITNSGCYDLWGREVKGKPQPGIYILNGRKVIIK